MSILVKFGDGLKENGKFSIISRRKVSILVKFGDGLKVDDTGKSATDLKGVNPCKIRRWVESGQKVRKM